MNCIYLLTLFLFIYDKGDHNSSHISEPILAFVAWITASPNGTDCYGIHFHFN
jgi:hypothetical protein